MHTRAVRVGAFALVLASPAAAWGFGLRAALTLVPPHRAHVSSAVLSPELRARIERELRARPVHTVDEAVAFSLAQTDRLLHFGLRHRTSMRFEDASREGHCVEYANLLAAVFTLAARAGGLHARAEVVRSDATLFGVRLPLAALRDHDWVRVSAPGASPRMIDPTLHDAWMGSDVGAAVVSSRAR